ncbi:Glycerophosphoryl diester phosphodiesterase [Acidisarcina polymorpha]|uniref:Glycerophosphoryl diester phosphodiesterase n=1 Tax=Acidisarcina polymorpha TaxID=2211140 RepID=A0A2Z5G7J9_9BACT|nr:hypothetical protein [Acidisarcina polymorpha]AXC14645.1 Glycerophosphoryl diester phosphodiesterase [Acidisarcina polymorpha]
MKLYSSPRLYRRETLRRTAAVVALGALTGSLAVAADDHSPAKPQSFFTPGNLVLSRSVYDNKASNVTVGEVLPPGCASTSVGCPAGSKATNSGIYPFVFNNVLADGSFGITSPIYLDQIAPDGTIINSLEVPNSREAGIQEGRSQLVTSFSSKSEVGLHLSTDGQYLVFMGYVAPVDALDVSNSNTPGAIDPTNPVGETYFRAAARVDRRGKFSFTETNAYSGNNGRAAILNNSDGNFIFYSAGNAGNGNNPQPAGVVLGAGAQIFDFAGEPESEQEPGTPTPVGSFSVTQLGAKADKIGKDDNFRGIAIFNNVVYFTKGSGGNGVNTVYFLDTTGAACPKGVGLPSTSATLPTTPIVPGPTLTTTGLPSNMCILKGFPSIPNKTATVTAFPFGLWFANATTLYVADEGDGYTGGLDLYSHAAKQTTAGLQKWVFDSVSQSWKLAYVLQKGLRLGGPNLITGYPTGINAATGLPWAPAADGLRNITGKVLPGGKVSIWGVTSTISGNGDTGADPNTLDQVIDVLANTDPSVAAGESFVRLRHAKSGEVYRGISFTPGSN